MENNSEYTEISNLLKEIDIPYGQKNMSSLAREGKIDAHKD